MRKISLQEGHIGAYFAIIFAASGYIGIFFAGGVFLQTVVHF